MNELTGGAEQSVPAPLAKRPESEVCATWESGGSPRVTIFCATYNHLCYIEDALCGFLGQITDFPFEVILVEDASTDGTTEVVRRYAQEYPRIIRAFIHEENNFRKSREGNGYVRRYARGEIWAFCDGDDYWTWSGKLQAQVDLLDRRPDVQLCFHRVLRARNGRLAIGPEWPDIYNGCLDWSGIEKLEYTCPPTASLVARRFTLDKRLFNNPNFDRTIVLVSAAHGSICGRSDGWAVYRLHSDGIAEGLSLVSRFHRDAVSRYWICRTLQLSHSAKAYHRGRVAANAFRALELSWRNKGNMRTALRCVWTFLRISFVFVRFSLTCK
jgi:glycosyltransferase involved in cell wall biosynthesis